MTIERFAGEHRWLSNFWPVEIGHEGAVYPSVEHAYQACKTLDPELRKTFQAGITPGQAKRLGRLLRVRPDWEGVKIVVMAQLLRKKFDEPSLRRRLMATGDEQLIEGNDWGDRFWGVCRGQGKNVLGRLLMDIRDELRREAA